MRMKIAVAFAALSVGFAGIAVGQDNAIPERQELMKENGGAMKAASEMAKGEKPYNETEAAAAMRLIADNLEEFPGMFPENSMEGGDPPTRAKAEIWSDTAGFEAAAAKTYEAAETAEAAAAQGQEAFAAALGPVGASCGDCHDMFRGPKPN